MSHASAAALAPPPAPTRAASSPSMPAEWLEVAATTLHLRRGEWVGVLGPGTEPLALLYVAAGLLRSGVRSRRWLDVDGRDTEPPTIAFVPASWTTYACFTVGDVLHLAATRGARTNSSRPSALAVDRAERRRVRAMEWASLAGIERRHVRSLHPYARWRVGVAAAVAGGARWLCLELPPALPLPGSAREAALCAMVEALRGAGVTALLCGGLAGRLPVTRLHAVGSAPGALPVARVAELALPLRERHGAGVASLEGAV